MNCSKNMIRVAAGIGAVFLAGYLAFPELRIALVSLAPFAAALICPISMLLMMKMMSSNKTSQTKEEAMTPVPVEPNRAKEIAS